MPKILLLRKNGTYILVPGVLYVCDIFRFDYNWLIDFHGKGCHDPEISGLTSCEVSEHFNETTVGLMNPVLNENISTSRSKYRDKISGTP